jgi:hypothetical protein
MANFPEILTQGKYNSTLPSPSDGSQTDVQLDTKGRLISSIGASNYINSVTSTTNLAAAGVFTSSIIDVLSAPAWVISVRADQPLTITVTQFSDLAGTLTVETTVFTRNASQPLNTTVKLSGSYARISVQNTGASTTTSFLTEAWVGVLETLPTSLTNAGNLRCAVVEEAISVPTYSAGFSGAITGATATDVFTITGSATRIIKVLNLSFSGTATTAAVSNLSLIKRSTANTLGTASVIASAPLDSQNGAATSVVRIYTANPTLGTQVAVIAAQRKEIVTAAFAAGDYQPYQFNFDTPITLRGAAETLALNLNSGTFAGNSFAFSITWTEE